MAYYAALPSLDDSPLRLPFGGTHTPAPEQLPLPPAEFIASERNALADAQLQRDARVESLQRQWAEAASGHADWLVDTTLLVSERWPTLEGGVRLDVRPLLSVVLLTGRNLHAFLRC